MTPPKPGVYWVLAEGWRLARVSYRKRGKVAVLETRAGTERMDAGRLCVKDVEPETAKRFGRILDET